MPAGRIKRSRGLHKTISRAALCPPPEMAIYRDNSLPIIVIAQNSFDLSLTDIAFVIISLSPINYRDKRFFMHTVIKVTNLVS